MHMSRFGKVPQLLIVVIWVLLIGGGLYAYYSYLENKRIAEEAAELAALEGDGEEGSRRGGGMPALAAGGGELGKTNTRPKRTTPFKYVFTDRAATQSESDSKITNITYAQTSLSDEDVQAGLLEWMLAGIEHYKKVNADRDQAKIETGAKLLTDVLTAKFGGGGESLTEFKAQFDDLLLDVELARDPLFQHAAAMVAAAADKPKESTPLFNSAILDYAKYDYPSRFVVSLFNERAHTNPKWTVKIDVPSWHVDAIAGWLQYDFSESPEEHAYCWVLIQDAIQVLAQNEQLDSIEKLIGKQQKTPFIAPWLAEMIQAEYEIQLAKANENDAEAIAKAKTHLEAALKINPNANATKKMLESL